MKTELILALSLVLAHGCSRSTQGGDEDNGRGGSMGASGSVAQGGECEGAADGSWCGLGGEQLGDDSSGGAMAVAMGSVQQVVLDSACANLGESRGATPEEEAEYCVCEDVYAGQPPVWSCYGADPDKLADLIPEATSCPTFVDSGGTDGNCEVSWTCNDGHHYSILCLNGACSCQIDGARRENLPRLEESIDTCITDLAEVNKLCFLELDGV